MEQNELTENGGGGWWGFVTCGLFADFFLRAPNLRWFVSISKRCTCIIQDRRWRQALLDTRVERTVRVIRESDTTTLLSTRVVVVVVVDNHRVRVIRESGYTLTSTSTSSSAVVTAPRVTRWTVLPWPCGTKHCRSVTGSSHILCSRTLWTRAGLRGAEGRKGRLEQGHRLAKAGPALNKPTTNACSIALLVYNSIQGRCRRGGGEWPLFSQFL